VFKVQRISLGFVWIMTAVNSPILVYVTVDYLHVQYSTQQTVCMYSTQQTVCMYSTQQTVCMYSTKQTVCTYSTQQILAGRTSVFLEIMKSLDEQPYWSGGTETHVALHRLICSQTSFRLHRFVSLLPCNFWLPSQMCSLSVAWYIIVQSHRSFYPQVELHSKLLL